MNLQQLRIIAEAGRQDFNLTQVARSLFISQPGISKTIRELEEELGFELFIRHGKRIKGFTEPGKRVMNIAVEILANLKKIREIKDDFSEEKTGKLVLATTHTQARYSLPELIKKFKNSFPKVNFVIYQSSPPEIASLLESGEADIGIATESLKDDSRFITIPFYHWHHSIIVPINHPLTNEKELTLKSISRFPIITYHQGFTGRSSIDEIFTKNNYPENIVLEALDADVIKAYVSLNLGIGIIASMAYDKTFDKHLKLIDGRKIFKKNTTVLAFRKGKFLKGYAANFASLCLKGLPTELIYKKISTLE